MLNPKTIEECYQMAIRAEEKVKRRQEKSTRGRVSTSRGRGTFSSSRQINEGQGDAQRGQEQIADFRGGFRGSRGKFGGRNPNIFLGRCYKCNEYGHPTWKCPKNIGASSSSGEKRNERRTHIV